MYTPISEKPMVQEILDALQCAARALPYPIELELVPCAGTPEIIYSVVGLRQSISSRLPGNDPSITC